MATDAAGNADASPASYAWTITAPAQCSDTVDNDGDGRIDYGRDPGCTSASDTTESPDAYACEPSYPTVCIRLKSEVGDLDCGDSSYTNFTVRHSVTPADPHVFDGDKDGVGCES